MTDRLPRYPARQVREIEVPADPAEPCGCLVEGGVLIDGVPAEKVADPSCKVCGGLGLVPSPGPSDEEVAWRASLGVESLPGDHAALANDSYTPTRPGTRSRPR